MDVDKRRALAKQHEIEQIGAALAEIAPVVARYFGGLREHGVPKREAAMLTAEMQAGLLELLLNTPEGP